MAVAPLHRTLEQELLALLRGASLECPVCGEFVLHDGAAVRCPECGMLCTDGSNRHLAGRIRTRRPGDRGAASGVEESPDTAGQDAPAREAAKADGKWHRKQTAGGVFSGDAAGKGETVG